MQRLRISHFLPWLAMILLFSYSAALRGGTSALPPATAQGDEYEDALDKAKLNFNRRNYGIFFRASRRSGRRTPR